MQRARFGSGVAGLAGAAIAIGLLGAVAVRAQTGPSTLRFEVASVKLAAPDSQGQGLRSSGIPGPDNKDPGRFTARLNLLNLLLTAYEIPLYRMADADDRFTPMMEVEAKMPVETTREQFDVMLQNLLAERLGLKIHWISKDVEMYTLVVAKGGAKIKPAGPDSPPLSDDAKAALAGKVGSNGFPLPPAGNGAWIGVAPPGKMVMRGHNETMAELARAIGRRTLPGPLTDATGMTGKYDYTIFWSMQATTAARMGTAVPDAASTPEGPSIYDAIEDQLGLKIELKKGPVQMMVVDHIEKKPSEN